MMVGIRYFAKNFIRIWFRRDLVRANFSNERFLGESDRSCLVKTETNWDLVFCW